MTKYTAVEYADMILIYGECHQNASFAMRTYRERYGETRICPEDSRIFSRAFQRIRENLPLDPNCHSLPTERGYFRSLSSSLDKKILEYFKKHPTSSIRRAAHHFNISSTTIHAVLKRENWQPFKSKKLSDKLLSHSKSVRLKFCRWLQGKIEEDDNFLLNICWTNVSTFTKNDVWNKYNFHYWAQQNSHFKEKPDPDRFAVNIWAGIHGNNIIGPVILNGSLNGTSFIDLLKQSVSEYTDSLTISNYQKMWYQLDGSPPHSVPEAQQCLNKMFGCQWIGRYGPQRWPPRSSDLSPFSFFLWKFIKRHVYKKDITTERELRQRIISAFDKVKTMVLNNAVMNKVRLELQKRISNSV